MLDETWGHEEVVADDVTVKELNELCKTMYCLKKESAELKKLKSDKELELKKVQHKVMAYLDHFGMTKHAGEFGSISKTRNFSVPSPQGLGKEQFFEFLKGRDDFEGLVSINHQTLNGYIRREIEEKSGKTIYADDLTVEEINEYTPVGLEKPKISYNITMRKK